MPAISSISPPPPNERQLHASELLNKTISFLKSEYDMDFIVFSCQSPPASSPHSPAAAALVSANSSPGMAADFLHTPAGRHVLSCWQHFCIATASAPPPSATSPNDMKSPAFNYQQMVPRKSLSPAAASEYLDTNENVVPSQSRKRPHNFLVNSLLTAHGAATGARPSITDLIGSDKLENNNFMLPLSRRGSSADDDNQVLDLSRNATPTSPTSAFQDFPLPASSSENPGHSPIEAERLLKIVNGENVSPEKDVAKKPRDESSFPTEDAPVRSRDDLKSFIREFGPIKKRSASLSSELDGSSSRYTPSPTSHVTSHLANESYPLPSIPERPASSCDSDAMWSCPICRKVMKKKCSYRHQKEVHGQNKEIVQCPVCSRSFTRRYTLVLHCRNVHPNMDIKSELAKLPEQNEDQTPSSKSSTDNSSQHTPAKPEPEEIALPPSNLSRGSPHHIPRSHAHDMEFNPYKASLLSAASQLNMLKAQAAMLSNDSLALTHRLATQGLINSSGFNPVELSMRLAQLERSQAKQES